LYSGDYADSVNYQGFRMYFQYQQGMQLKFWKMQYYTIFSFTMLVNARFSLDLCKCYQCSWHNSCRIVCLNWHYPTSWQPAQQLPYQLALPNQRQPAQQLPHQLALPNKRQPAQQLPHQLALPNKRQPAQLPHRTTQQATTGTIAAVSLALRDTVPHQLAYPTSDNRQLALPNKWQQQHQLALPNKWQPALQLPHQLALPNKRQPALLPHQLALPNKW
jgi:hypothetical protein